MIEEELDTQWIHEFEKTDQLYQDFYVDDLYYINTQFIYINKENHIEKIREETFLMKTPNLISREEIIGLLKKNSVIENDQKYIILSLLKFNIGLNHEDIEYFLKNSNLETMNKLFLKPIEHIDAIPWEKTISMFQDLNTLYFIFIERNNQMDSLTKKNLTKRIYLHLSGSKKRRKTIRKPY